MAQPHDASLVTPAEYLAFELGSETKHEYLAGRVFAMAGASPKHNLVCGNLIRALGERLRARRCAVMPSDHGPLRTGRAPRGLSAEPGQPGAPGRGPVALDGGL